jgi:hypothetical protein
MPHSLVSTRPPSRLFGTAVHALLWSLPVAMLAAVEGGDQTRWGIVTFWVLWVFLGTAICNGLALLARRLQVLSWRPARQVLAGIAAAFVGTLTFCSVTVPFVLATAGDVDVTKDLVGSCLIVALTFVAWVPAAMFVGQTQRLGQAERETLRVRAEASETELRTVRQQVNAHLVFNALNSILVAVEERAPQAASMVLDLSRLLRQSLEALPHMGTLGDELARLELYIRIEKSRFEDDLRVTLDVAPALHNRPCLPMLLQPLVENAIKHGIPKPGQPLCIEVRVEDRNGLVTAWVTNDGSLREGEGAMSRTSEPTGDGAGLGLRATRHRLEREYGAAATLELSPSMVDGGDRVTATVCWPAPDPVEGSADGVLP